MTNKQQEAGLNHCVYHFKKLKKIEMIEEYKKVRELELYLWAFVEKSEEGMEYIHKFSGNGKRKRGSK